MAIPECEWMDFEENGQPVILINVAEPGPRFGNTMAMLYYSTGSYEEGFESREQAIEFAEHNFKAAPAAAYAKPTP